MIGAMCNVKWCDLIVIIGATHLHDLALSRHHPAARSEKIMRLNLEANILNEILGLYLQQFQEFDFVRRDAVTLPIVVTWVSICNF